MTTAAESKLVQQARTGNVQAFESLYRLYNDRIYNLAKQVTCSTEDAGDVVQETFIRAWNSLPDLRSDGTFGIWLHRIALNRCRDILKKRARQSTASLDNRQADSDGDSIETQFESDLPNPEQVLVSMEVRNAVRRAVDTLSAEQRAVVTMHHMEGMDVESIASILSVPKGTVMSRLSRARKVLRRKLAPYVEGERNE